MITLKDKLSHLSYNQACKLLGDRGKQLIMAGGKYDTDLFERVTFNSKRFQLDLGDAKVEIALDPMKPRRLSINCSACSVACEHQGATLSLILEENLLAILSDKHELSLAVLDPDSDAAVVDMAAGIEELKRRLEILLGEKPAAAEDESMKERVEKEAQVLTRKKKIAVAGGQLVGGLQIQEQHLIKINLEASSREAGASRAMP